MLRLVLDLVFQTRALEWESQQLRLNQDSEQATLHVNINPLNAKDINEDAYMSVPTSKGSLTMHCPSCTCSTVVP